MRSSSPDEDAKNNNYAPLRGSRVQSHEGGVEILAEPTGLEPATFHVTGGRSNQLNYDSVLYNFCRLQELYNTPRVPAGRQPRVLSNLIDWQRQAVAANLLGHLVH